MYRFHQGRDVVRRCVLADAVSEVENLRRAGSRALVGLAKAVEHAAHFLGNLGRRRKQHVGVDIALQGLAWAVLGTADRSELAAAQTPQGFPATQLAQAYAQAVSSGSTGDTDDAATFAAAGFEVITIPGDARAFKITTAEDLARANTELLGLTSDLRIGQGVDVHAFGEAENLWLAGLHWPGEKELSGHSDGDAVAHAITDALLAAAGLGDIGSNFGVDDPTFANARGEVFVRGAVKLVNEAGFDVLNVSVQIIGNRPKFSPRRDEANRVVGEWLGAPVNVSATTTDGLGFTGRGEGIAAQATALLRARG